MKIEVGKGFPEYFKPSYPEEFELFSHFEVTAGIPTALFAITHGRKTASRTYASMHGAASTVIRQRSLP